MKHVRHELTVCAERDEVFAAHVDASRIPEWFPGVEAIDGPDRIDHQGATYTLTFDKYIANEQVLRSEPPSLHERSFHQLSRPAVRGVATLCFEARGDVTAMSIDVDYVILGPLGWLFELLPPVRRLVSRDILREVEAFKAFVEQEAVQAPRPGQGS